MPWDLLEKWRRSGFSGDKLDVQRAAAASSAMAASKPAMTSRGG